MKRQHEGKKPTRNLPVREYIPDSVCIPLGVHLGAPSEPCVQKGDIVKVGQVIANPVGFLGIPVHASISGEVTDVCNRPYLGSGPMQCICIQNDFQDDWIEHTPVGDVETVDPARIIPAIKDSGICGMGGASFPTHVKLTIREDQRCDTIIINGAECETFLTADDRLMRETPERILNGLRLVMRALNVSRGVIAIEDNKPEAIAAMRNAAQGREGVSILPLKTKYPQGGEKQLIEAVTGKQVPSGQLPMAVNTIVLNVATAAAISDAITLGRPLISRITTVTGRVKNPDNLLLRNGTIIGDAIGECGGFSEEPGKIALGGGMTGICAPNDEIPASKAQNGIVVYNVEEGKSLEETACLRCARCVQACPMGLDPYLLKHYCDADKMAEAQAHNVVDCIVCGCCSYVCPSRRWLTASFKNMKDKIALAAKRG